MAADDSRRVEQFLNQASHLRQLPLEDQPRVVAGFDGRLRRHHAQRREAGVQRLAQFVSDQRQELVLARNRGFGDAARVLLPSQGTELVIQFDIPERERDVIGEQRHRAKFLRVASCRSAQYAPIAAIGSGVRTGTTARLFTNVGR